MTRTPRAILIIFCLSLTAPAIGGWLGLDVFTKNIENRNLAIRPELSWSRKFPRLYQDYFNDNFGLRHTLISVNFLFRYKLLGVSPSSLVLAGREGWLYYTGDGEIADYRGVTQFTEGKLHRWLQVLLLKREWLAQRNIRYLIVIAPNKSTVYPEYLPAGYSRVRPQSGLDDFIDFIRNHSDLEIVDLRSRLYQEKTTHDLYYRTDTHWNNYGAFLGYQEILKPLVAWFPEITPFTADDFDITKYKRGGGDLSAMIGGLEFLEEDYYELKPKNAFTAIMNEQEMAPRNALTMTKAAKNLPRIVVFRDSFFNPLIPMISEHFSTSRYISSFWDSKTPIEDILAKYQPQIVMEEIVERFLKGTDTFDEGLPSYLQAAVIAQALSSGKAQEIPLDQLSSGFQAGLKYVNSELLVKVEGPDPQLLIPTSLLQEGLSHGALLRVAVESPTDSHLQLFYKTRASPAYSENRSVRVPIQKGFNQVNLMIIDQEIVGQLRLDPGNVPGEYSFKQMTLFPLGG